ILGIRPLEAYGIVVPEYVNSGWGYSVASIVAVHKFVHGDPPPKFTRRQISSPLTDDMLAPLLTRAGVVQFSTMLTEREFIRLANWLRDYPEVTLRAFSSFRGNITNLEFLRFFPFLRRFSVDASYHTL